VLLPLRRLNKLCDALIIQTHLALQAALSVFIVFLIAAEIHVYDVVVVHCITLGVQMNVLFHLTFDKSLTFYHFIGSQKFELIVWLRSISFYLQTLRGLAVEVSLTWLLHGDVAAAWLEEIGIELSSRIAVFATWLLSLLCCSLSS
tara:strand:+ start:193 stop:630 length:438 start_codon:yes stop_codon:yes gene_type:complete